MEKINLDKYSLRKFAILIGVIFLALGFMLFLKRKDFNLILGVISAAFFVFAFTKPELLKPIYIAWMKLAFVLGWINTRIILIIAFYLVFTPVALLLRMFGKDILDKGIDNSRNSYWIKKEQKSFCLQDYERQF